ncbi:MAG: acyltransferase [Planctomycetaceae bacterium]|nr:acyltransferase [Planctomycetaceae bacterium]
MDPSVESYPAAPSAGIASVFQQKHLPALDGLRFIAVMLVIFDHGGIQHSGGDGVTYFFVLSGFLFSWLFSRQWEKEGSISFRRYYWRRTMRIMPACYACILFTIAGRLLLQNPVDYNHALAAATYTANYYNALNDHPATGFSFFWSLAVEEQFYLIWPMVFVYGMTRGRQTLIRILLLTIGAVCCWRSLLRLGFDVESPWLYNAFDTRIDSIAIGCLLGMIIQEAWFQRFLKVATASVFFPILTIACVMGVHKLPEDFHYSVGFTIESFFIGLGLLQLLVLSRHKLWNWLNWKPIQFLGVLSYSMYLYHAWGLAVGWKFTMLPLTAQVLIGALATVVLACFSYYLVELPFQRMRDRWEPKPQPITVPARGANAIS